jgi:hypothetical protein
MSAISNPLPATAFTEEELIALKALANKPERKWWGDYPFLVSLLAFILSLTTALISAYESHQRDIHDQESQLSAALGTLQDLNLKEVELHVKYKDTPYETQAAGLINNQLNSTLRTAGELGLRLGTNATTAELAGIAQGLYGLGDYAATEKLLRYALSAAETANDESIALRELGFYLIRTGKGGAALKQGEDYFAQAFNLDRKYDLSEQPYSISWLRSSAQLGWAEALAPIDCPAAQKHFGEAVAILAAAPATIDFDQQRAQAKQQWPGGIGGVPACPPAPGTAPLP